LLFFTQTYSFHFAVKMSAAITWMYDWIVYLIGFFHYWRFSDINSLEISFPGLDGPIPGLDWYSISTEYLPVMACMKLVASAISHLPTWPIGGPYSSFELYSYHLWHTPHTLTSVMLSKQACLQSPASAVNMTLLTFAAECRAVAHSATPLLVSTCITRHQRLWCQMRLHPLIVAHTRTELTSRPATWHIVTSVK